MEEKQFNDLYKTSALDTNNFNKQLENSNFGMFSKEGTERVVNIVKQSKTYYQAIKKLDKLSEEDGFNDSGQIAFRFALEDEREGIALWSPDRVITSFNLAITRATSSEMGFDLEWDSEPGKSYDLVSSIDLATPISDWQVYDPPGGQDNDRTSSQN